jgi:hypothetical protein
VSLSREGTTVILDEVIIGITGHLNAIAHADAQFYSWYVYPTKEKNFGHSISSAEYIEDVDSVRCAHPSAHMATANL